MEHNYFIFIRDKITILLVEYKNEKGFEMRNKIIKGLVLLTLSTTILTGCNSGKILTYKHNEVKCGEEVLRYLKYKEKYNLGCSIEKDGLSGYGISIFKYENTKENECYSEVHIEDAPIQFIEKYFGEDFNEIKGD